MTNVSMIDGHIDEPKITDDEVIKALKCCAGEGACDDACPGNKVKCETEKYTLDLIYRQKADVERLRDYINHKLSATTDLIKAYDLECAKAEAYKECIGKVKEEINEALKSNYKARAERESRRPYSYLDDDFWNYCNGKIHCLRGLDYFLDNILKEMAGDNNGRT